MDRVLEQADRLVLTPYIYPASWPEDNTPRQILSLFAINSLGGFVLYSVTAWLGYLLLFDKELMNHPQFLKDQIRLEIIFTLKVIPQMGIPTALVFLLEVKGYSKLYDNASDTHLGYYGVAISVVTFILFTDMCIYWIHRGLHHRLLYGPLHKYHHKWKIPTPFASHAFHPLDGFLQSCPYHIYPFLFPLHKMTYLMLFVFVNIWTVSIHDGNYKVPYLLKPVINGSAHHMDHHVFFTCNYGQFFTLWDRIGGSFRTPSSFLGKGPGDFVRKKTDVMFQSVELDVDDKYASDKGD